MDKQAANPIKILNGFDPMRASGLLCETVVVRGRSSSQPRRGLRGRIRRAKA